MRVIPAVLVFVVFLLAGCATDKVYVDTEKVQGLGAVVEFPSGKIVPIKVRNVISGNTLKLTNGEKVVYIGVHVPDIYDAKERAKRLNKDLAENQDIRFEFDEKQRDPNGNLLVYAYTKEGKLINAEIIRQGLAEALVRPPNKLHEQKLLRAEGEARISKKGIWAYDFKGKPR
jgi:micrococcal nuclease